MRKVRLDINNDCIHVDELEPCFLGTNGSKGRKKKTKANTN